MSDCTITEPNMSGKDESGSLRKKLWEATEKLIKDNGFDLPSSIWKQK
jgi:hypothetical protein